MIWILILFLLLHLLFVRHQARDDDTFFLARRDVSPMTLGMSLSATILGASAVLGTLGWGWDYGLAGSAWLLAGVVGLALLWIFVPRLPDVSAFSIAQQAARNTPFLRKTMAILIVPMWVAVAAAQIKALAALFTAVSSLPPELVVALICTIVYVYLFFGGQRAVITSDAFQFLFISVAITLGLVLILMQSPSFSLAPLRPFQREVGVVAMFPVILSYLLGPDIHSRLLAAPDATSRRRALTFAMVTIGTLGIALAVIGWAAHDFVSPTTSWQTGIILIAQLPFPLAAFMNIALCAALLSSLDTTLLTTSTLLSVDLVGQGARTTRWLLLPITITAALVALRASGLIALLMLAYRGYAGILGAPVLFSLFRQRISIRGLAVSMIGSCIILGIFSLYAWSYAVEFAFIWGFVSLSISSIGERE